VEHKQKKRTCRRRQKESGNNKDKKQSEKTRELERVKRHTSHSSLLFAVVGFHSLDGALLNLVFFPLVTGDFMKYAVNTLHISYDIQ